VTLILRPRGITSGNEIAWPGDWQPSGWFKRKTAAPAEPAPPEPSPGATAAAE
jgi:hypothetical protein